MPQKPKVDLKAEIDQLYQLPLSEFVKARNELSKRVRAAGDREAAAQIKSLAKPSVSAWAVNQVFWNAPREFEALLASGERLRAAQQAAAGAAEMRAAGHARRNAAAALLRRAEEILRETSHGVGSDVLRRIEKSLEAAASYGASQPEPGPGRLIEDLAPPGFDVLSAFAASLPSRRSKNTALKVVPPPKAVAAESTSAARRRRRMEEKLAAVQRRAVTLRAEAKRLNEALAKAEDVAAAAQVKVERAQQQFEEARLLAEQSKSKVDEARSKAQAADKAAAAAREKAEEVRTQLQRLVEKK